MTAFLLLILGLALTSFIPRASFILLFARWPVPEEAWLRIRAGATLVQLYTGFIYGGPLTPRAIAKGLARLARAAGYARVQDAVGADASAAIRSTSAS